MFCPLDAAGAPLTTTLALPLLQALVGADFVVEAVPEDESIKKSLFVKLDSVRVSSSTTCLLRLKGGRLSPT